MTKRQRDAARKAAGIRRPSARRVGDGGDRGQAPGQVRIPVIMTGIRRQEPHGTPAAGLRGPEPHYLRGNEESLVEDQSVGGDTGAVYQLKSLGQAPFLHRERNQWTVPSAQPATIRSALLTARQMTR
jgi:hypothetical protein